jgi:hypothetical protein
MTWKTNLLYLGLGALSCYVGSAIDTISKVYQTFQKHECKNTVLPKKLEQYVPKKIINTIEMTKFLFERGWIELEQLLRRSCVKKKNVYHVKFVIENKMYALIVKPERGPDSQYVIEDQYGINQTENIKPYIRGALSISKSITPKVLGYSSLIKYIPEREKISSYDLNDQLVV